MKPSEVSEWVVESPEAGMLVVRFNASNAGRYLHIQLDNKDAQAFWDSLFARIGEGETLILDFDGVVYTYSSFWAKVVTAGNVLRRHNGWLVLCSLGPEVRDFLEAARLD